MSDFARIDVSALWTDCITAKPLDYDWSEHEYGETWDIVRPDVDSWDLRRCSAYLEDNGYSGDDGRFQVNPFAMDRGEIVAALEAVSIECRDDESDDELREALIANMDDSTIKGIDDWRNAVSEHMDGSEYGMPMMNYAYPLADRYNADAIDQLPCCSVVTIDDEPYLALTGGGMDLSWEICESYIRLGFLPPVHFADLPRMAGRGQSPEDQLIIAACRRSCEILIRWTSNTLESLSRLGK